MNDVNDVRFNGVEEIERLINEIPLEQRINLLSAVIKAMPVDARSRLFGFSEDDDLIVVTGSIVNLNAEIAVNFQNSNGNGFDPNKLIGAILDWKRSQGL